MTERIFKEIIPRCDSIKIFGQTQSAIDIGMLQFTN